jgi:hypothetical protein
VPVLHSQSGEIVSNMYIIVKAEVKNELLENQLQHRLAVCFLEVFEECAGKWPTDLNPSEKKSM